MAPMDRVIPFILSVFYHYLVLFHQNYNLENQKSTNLSWQVIKLTSHSPELHHLSNQTREVFDSSSNFLISSTFPYVYKEHVQVVHKKNNLKKNKKKGHM